MASMMGRMEITWQFDETDAERVRALIKSAEVDPFQPRMKPVTKDWFWKSLVSTLLKPQQFYWRSNLINGIINAEPFPLRLEVCLPSIDAFAQCQHTPIPKRRLPWFEASMYQADD
jgi:hypothetical protein